MASRIFKVGVTGGIAAGKSTVCKVLRSKGFKTIEADKLGHLVYAPNTVGFDKVVASLGKGVLNESNDEIDRAKLGAMVFGPKNTVAMKKLTDILWPAIGELTQTQIKEFEQQGEKIVFVEAHGLIEAGWQNFLDEVWTVSVPRSVAIQRLIQRHKEWTGLDMTTAEAEQRLDSQLSNEERAKYADVVIDSNRPKEETEVIVLEQLQKTLANLGEKAAL
eukprot:TRINITY_DN358_c1_g1_i1.p1 TRINITY_DN358_c1_g1~~TRINITY_DN358_c1_g1_i1.p1  ORF type:complete len:219 (+),score=37.19 TRINITY_DN358_c1_g1_i1:156-812(+)